MRIAATQRNARTLLWLALACAAAAAQDGGAPPDPDEWTRMDIEGLRLRELLPADAVDYVDAAAECTHWSGEEAYDEARAREIEQGSQASCTDAATRKRRIEARYPRGSAVATTLAKVIAQVEAFEDDYVWDDPERTSPALDRYFRSQAASVIEAVDRLAARHDRERLEYQRGLIAPLLAQGDRLSPATREALARAADKADAALE